MKTAAYIRVSTQDQRHAAQRAEIERWLANHQVADVVWFEDKESGATMDRPGIKALQSAIFAGEVKTVVVWKLDRIARSQKEGINLLGDWCEKGVRLVAAARQSR